ncbi:MAG: hypothetical protein Q8914_05810 [Bacteroidota bacterium]|nr:hypothetical protein [Bacteroidota bacterium]
MNKLRLVLFMMCLGLLWSCGSDNNGSDASDNGKGGSMARFTVKGDYLYIVDCEHLMTFDISDSSKLVLKSSVDAGWNIETIFPSDSMLFLGSTDGLHIFNLKHPSKPAYVSCYTHVTSCDPVVVDGHYAYVTLRSDNYSCWRSVNQLQVIDISQITKPEQVGSYEMVSPKGLAVSGNLLFVCDGLDLVVMDASDPLQLKEKKRIQMDGTPYDVIANNGVLTISYSDGISQYACEGDSVRWISQVY